MASAVESAEDGLLAILQARALVPGSALQGVTLQLGDPGSNVKDEHVFITEDPEAEQSWATTGIGGQQKHEEFELRVICFVRRSGLAFAPIRNRVQALAEEIAVAVRADPTLNGAVWDAEVRRIVRETGAAPRARLAEAAVHVRCLAFLS